MRGGLVKHAGGVKPMNRVIWGSILFLGILLLPGCSPAVGGDDSGDGSGPERFLTGIVRDYVTGEPITGATVDLDDVSVVTGADGRYSLSLGTSTNTQTRSFSFGKAGYQAQCYTYPMDCSTDIDMGMSMLYPQNFPTGYATKSLSGKIYRIPEAGGDPEEIDYAQAHDPKVIIINKEGGTNSGLLDPVALEMTVTASGYAVEVVTFGTDCTVILEIRSWVSSGYRDTPLVVIKEHVDLSSPATVVDFTEVAGSTVTVTGDADAATNVNRVQCMLLLPVGRYILPTREFSGSNSLVYTVINPFNYPVQWKQELFSATELSGFYITYNAWTASSAMAGSVTLPAIPHPTGMDTGISISGITYSGGDLSVPAIAGANMYQFNIGTLAASKLRLHSTDPVVTLPAWIRAQFAGQSLDVGVYVGYISDWQSMGLGVSGSSKAINPHEAPTSKVISF